MMHVQFPVENKVPIYLYLYEVTIYAYTVHEEFITFFQIHGQICGRSPKAAEKQSFSHHSD